MGTHEFSAKDIKPVERTRATAEQGGSSCCGGAAPRAGSCCGPAAGERSRARLEGVRPAPASAVTEVVIGVAREAELPAIETLLAEVELPTDVAPHLGSFLVARHREVVVGCAGLEVRGTDALFRSLAVHPAYRGVGLGRRLYQALVELAHGRGVARAYLLTTTIEPLAESWGFRRIEREAVPGPIRETTQFRGACCTSAVAMWRDLGEPAAGRGR